MTMTTLKLTQHCIQGRIEQALFVGANASKTLHVRAPSIVQVRGIFCFIHQFERKPVKQVGAMFGLVLVYFA